MGMNYYLKSKPCKECGNCAVTLHIGKSSYGWQFHFRGYPMDFITTLKDWKREFTTGNREIRNENNEILSIEDFLRMIEEKKDGISPYNIWMNIPQTEEERRYLKNNGYRDVGNERRYQFWKDNEGYSFDNGEFS